MLTANRSPVLLDRHLPQTNSSSPIKHLQTPGSKSVFQVRYRKVGDSPKIQAAARVQSTKLSASAELKKYKKLKAIEEYREKKLRKAIETLENLKKEAETQILKSKLADKRRKKRNLLLKAQLSHYYERMQERLRQCPPKPQHFAQPQKPDLLPDHKEKIAKYTIQLGLIDSMAAYKTASIQEEMVEHMVKRKLKPLPTPESFHSSK